MTVIVKNVGPLAFTSSGGTNTKSAASTMGDQGTVRFIYEGQEYVWGPNESKTLEDGIGAAAVAAESRLRIIDSRDGAAQRSNASLSYSAF